MGSFTSHAPTMRLGGLLLVGKLLQPYKPIATEAKKPAARNGLHLFMRVHFPLMPRPKSQLKNPLAEHFMLRKESLPLQNPL